MTYSAEVLADSPAGYWRLGEASGTAMADSSGNSRGGTYNASGVTLGQPGLLAGDSDTAVAFDGSNGYANVPAASWMDTGTALTVECIVKVATAPASSSYYALLDRDDLVGVGLRSFQWRINHAGGVEFIKITGTVVTASSTGANVADGQPHHLAATYDGTTIRLYVDGTQVGTAAASGSMSQSGVRLRLGINNGGDASPGYNLFKGVFDEAAFYASTLSAARIAAHYAAMTTTANITLADVPAVATATALPETLTIAQPLALADAPAVATATALPEVLSFTGPLALDDVPAVATATALPETLTIGGNLTLSDVPAIAAAVALPEVLQLGSNITLADVPAVAIATALPEALTGIDARAMPWTADKSGQSSVTIDFLPAIGVVTYPPAPAPSVVMERPLTRQSHQLPTLTPGQVADGSHPVVTGVVGVPHVWVGGVDVTYFRDVVTQIGQHALELPGGCSTCTLTFPQVSPFEARTGALSWMKPNAPVEVALVDSSGVRHEQWAGRMPSQAVSDSGSLCTWTCTGDVIDDAQSEQWQPPIIQDPEDIGHVISRALTKTVLSRRYGPVKSVTTGILTSQRGSSDDYVWDYVSSLLATAWTDTGKQWTVKPGSYLRQPVIKLKDTGATTWTVTLGAPGISVQLDRDETQYTNVIYGRGIGPDGYAWEGRCYPNLRADNAPPFPYSTVGHLILVGTTDAMTDTGHGVSDMQQQIRDMGYPISVTGVYTSDQVGVVEQAQAAAGISVDGQIGPQTWATFFAVGSNAGNLNASYRRPIAIDPRVDPYLYAINGAITGANPVYDRSIPRRCRSIDYGDNTTKAQATADAKNQIQREMTAGWSGTIDLQTDPWEGSRAYIVPGDKIAILGWLGTTSLTLQVVSLTRDPSSAYKVSLTVDTLGRDAMTLDSIRKRNIDAKGNLALRPGNVEKSTKTTVVPFDGESGQAGIIPKFQLNGGYWTVIHVPVSIGGQIAYVNVNTSAPPAPFIIATFASPVTASQLIGLGFGNPLASGTDTLWQTKATDLLNLGWIETWGSASQPCGYYPGQLSGGGTLTGREFDTNPVSFTSNRGGYVWVALYSSADCYIQGTIKPGPVQP